MGSDTRAGTAKVAPFSKARVADTKDLRGILEIERLVFPHAQDPLSRGVLDCWLSRSEGNVFVMEDNMGRQHGYAAAVPLRFEALYRLKGQSRWFTALELQRYLLSNDEAKRNVRGNLVLAAMTAFDPMTRKESYECAIPLFLQLLRSFYRMRMFAVVAHARSQKAKEVMQYAGLDLVPEPNRQGMSIAMFDGATAQCHVASGLSVVYYTTWSIHHSSGRLGLTTREREVLDAIGNAEIPNATVSYLAHHLGLQPNTIRDRLKSIYRKAEYANVIPLCEDTEGKRFPRRTALAEVLAYYHTHPEERPTAPREVTL